MRRWRASLLLSALPVAVITAAMFAGCTDLVDQANDSGAGGPSESNDLADAGNTPVTPVDEAGSSALDAAKDGQDGASGPLVDCAAEDAGFGPPNDLQCTGLYSDFKTKTVNANIQPFDPGIHLWSDGAEKTRWIFLPPGTQIDTTDMNEWRFPVGTKVWKEFKVSKKRIETRMFWKRGDNDWVRGTYQWSDDDSQATYLATGATNVAGTTYAIPTVEQCDTCHAGRIDHLLGYDAVSLSQPTSSGLNVQALKAANLLTLPPTSALTIPDDGTGKATIALGWLHANCGTACHNNSPGSFAGATGLWMRLEVGVDGTLGAYINTNTYKTAVNQPVSLAPFNTEGFKRIKPNDTFVGEGLSLIPYRDGKRNESGIQMPPIASSIVDLKDLASLRDWIQNGTFPAGSYPP